MAGRLVEDHNHAVHEPVPGQGNRLVARRVTLAGNHAGQGQGSQRRFLEIAGILPAVLLDRIRDGSHVLLTVGVHG